MPWGPGEVKRRRTRGRLRSGKGLVALALAPRQRDELAAVLRDALGDRLLAVEDRAIAVGDLDLALALDDDRTQDPAGAVDLEIALDVHQTAEGEVAVDGEVAVHVQQSLAGASVVLEVAGRVLARSVV